jgi:hypothetical protein
MAAGVVTSADQCDAAATELNLSDTSSRTYAMVGQNVPSHCFESRMSGLWFNSYEASDGDCSDWNKCVCVEAYQTAPVEPAVNTTAAPAAFDFGLQAGQDFSTETAISQEVQPCPCKTMWTYANVTHYGCAFTHDSVDPWCDIALPAPATCTEDFVHTPEDTHSGDHQNPWTFCDHVGEVRHDLTMAGCHCKADWSYFGTSHSHCAQTHDSGNRLWCFVVEGEACASRMSSEDAAEHPGGTWDWCAMQPQQVHSTDADTTVHNCHCKEPWTYHNVEHHGCAISPDSQARPWCYVREGEECKSGYEWLHGEHVHWDWCWEETDWAETINLKTAHLCHCKTEWFFEGKEQNGCMAMPEDPSVGWCPVLEEEHCVEGYTMDDADDNIVYYDFCSPQTNSVSTSLANPDNKPIGVLEEENQEA